MANVLEIILSGNSRELDATLSKAEKNLSNFGNKMKDIGGKMSTYISLPLAAAGGAAIKFASDFNESLNKVDVAFKSSSQSVKDFAKTSLQSFGIAEGTALDMAALFGDMSTSMGLSTKEAAKLSTSLVGLAGDLSSFKNMNIEEVTTALNGIFTGETESLKRLGIVMTEANLKAYALTQGLSANIDQLSQGEKVMLRYNYVMAMTKNAQGDFARTSDGAANQMRMFTESLKQLGNQFGQIMLPLFTKIVQALNGLTLSFSKLSDETKTFIVVIGGLVALTGPLLYLGGTILPKLVSAFKLLNYQVSIFGVGIKALPLAGLALGLGMAAKGAYDYVKAMNVKTTFSEDETKNAEALRNTIKQIDEQIAKQKSLQSTMQTQRTVVTGLNTMTDQFGTTNKNLIATLEEKKQKALALLAIQERMTTQTIIEDEVVNKVKKSYVDISKELEKSKAVYERLTKAKIEFYEADRKRLIGDTGTETIGDKALVKGTTKEVRSPLSIMNERINNDLAQYKFLLNQQAGIFNDSLSQITPIAQGIENVFSAMGEGIIQSLNIANTGFGSFISGMASFLIDYAGMAIKKMMIDKATATSTATTGAIQAAGASGPAFPIVLPAILAGVLALVGSAFKKVPKFADGGIVSGPTMAMVGEYSGAKRNPEIIAPLDRLQSMIGGAGGNVNVSGEFVVRGQDLVLALQRADQFKNRIS